MTESQNADETELQSRSSLKIAYAVARQRIQDLHFHSVMELIERSRGEVAAPQATAIYSRLHRLSELDTQTLKNRVMVHMGRATDVDIQHLPNTFVAIDGAVEWDISASLVDRIRKRVGGRRRHALREWVELHTGHVEMQLLRLHVECIRTVRKAAGAEIRLKDLVRSYAQEMRVRESMLDALYYGVLEDRFTERPKVEQRPAPEGSRVDDNPGADHGTSADQPAPESRRQA